MRNVFFCSFILLLLLFYGQSKKRYELQKSQMNSENGKETERPAVQIAARPHLFFYVEFLRRT